MNVNPDKLIATSQVIGSLASAAIVAVGVTAIFIAFGLDWRWYHPAATSAATFAANMLVCWLGGRA